MSKEAVALTFHGHPEKPTILHNLGNCLSTRFQRLGELNDVEDAISTLREAVDLGHPDKPRPLNTLGYSFKARFERFGELSDLEHAIVTFRDVIDLTPRGHPEKLTGLNNLGTCFEIRFERLGELRDLEYAISMFRDAVDLTPHGHPHKARHFSNLGRSFRHRFERCGELSDLNHAISMLRDAVDLTPHGHHEKPGYIISLGNSFITRFNRLGELTNLEDAISTFRDAVDFIPRDHPDKPNQLNNLGISLLARFERLGELGDLEDAISTLKDAVDLTPHGHPEKPNRLNNLGISISSRSERFGELSDIDYAISTLRDAVELTIHGHQQQPMHLTNLGNTLLSRFNRLGELSDLEDAISRHRKAVDLTPHGHTHKPGYLNSLGTSLKCRFQCLGELSDLEHAISTLKDAVDITPHGHPSKSGRLGSLADTFRARFEHAGDLRDLEHAILLFSLAASDPHGPIRLRVRSSQHWISCARRIHHHTLLHAYSVAISLLPQLAWIGLSLTDRYSELGRGANLVREAAAAVLDSGLPETAVEWLEQGRSIVWGELFQLRSAYEELSSVHPEHSRRLRELSAALEHASSTREKSLSTISEETQIAAQCIKESLRQEVDKHHTLAIKRDKLLQEIRGLPGFEQFLLRKEFHQLRASAHTGPVVILNAAESRCDALIVLADVDHVIHVPLPKFPFKRCAGFQKMLEKLLGHHRAVLCDDRKGDPATWGCVSWESFLSVLWNDVIRPVLNALAFSTGDLSRIFWCPTGPFVFLPIHAAGIYGTRHSQPGNKVSDFVVSSYVPTLSILVPSLTPTVIPSDDLRLLVVGQPPSDGLPPLPGVDIELEHIRAVIGHSPSVRTTLLESSVGTVEEVLSLMQEADWVHFACHGIQDAADSGLCLADRRRLKLRDIIALSRPRGGLAFLSACQTAMGDEHLSDEAIHIAAGMLFAGYGGVIGTMWSISDKLAPDVARDVYTQLFRNDTRPDYRDAARALHEAIGRVRETVPFHIWLPFIHVGL
ncbi:hypothetical protein OG21DRAFT_1416447 [Imleria badia]|nr:hypothetical protein OG21DRAFT_1416447 [Imleria badia]